MRKALIKQFKSKISLLFIMLSITMQVNATTYYSRISGGNWNSNATWSTVTYGNATNTGTFPKKGDVAFIANAHTVYITANLNCQNVTIGQGTSGVLEFAGTGNYTAIIDGTVTVRKNAQFRYTANASRTHSLQVGANLINAGFVKFYVDANDRVNVTFNSALNSTVSGTGTYTLNMVTVAKSSTANLVNVTSTLFGPAIKTLTLTKGIYSHNNAGTYNVDPAAASFTIGGDATLAVPNGTVNLAPAASLITLNGRITVNGGNLVTGIANTTQGIRYKMLTTIIPGITISSGTMCVYGGISNIASASSSPVAFTMSGGTLLLNSGTGSATIGLLNVNDVPTSSFAMSGGKIILQKPNANAATVPDFAVCGTNGTVTVTDGTVEFGNASTPTNSTFNFVPYPGVVQPHFKVTGPAAAIVTVKTSRNSTVDFSLMSLKIEANKIFDIRAISGTKGDTKTMTLTSEMDGLNGFYNDGLFRPQSGIVKFQAPEGQWLSGASTTTFYDLMVSNPYGISVNTNVNISHQLQMLSGVAYTNSSTMITLLASATSNIGSSTSFIDGPVAKIVASAAPQTINFPIGRLISYRPMILSVQHSSAAAVTYVAQLYNSSARAMSYALPATLTLVSDVRYYNVTRTAVPNLTSARITLSYGTDDVVTDYTKLRIARDNGTAAWLDIGGSGTANVTGSITSSAFNAFNQFFTLGNNTGGTNPLPVELVSFNASAESNNVKLSWSTASEINSDYFDVESSSNGRDFTFVTRTTAAGNSSIVNNYAAYDLLNGRHSVYYRLKMTDRDGTYKYSDVKIIRSGKLITINTFPNPAPEASFNFRLPETITGNWTVALTDYAGRTLMTSGGDNNPGDMVNVHPAEKIPSGIYMMILRDDTGIVAESKIIVTDF